MSLIYSFSRALRHGLLRNSIINFPKSRLQKYSKIWEPDYVEKARLRPPTYDLVNIQIKGYDYAVLEKFQSFIHKMAKIMNLDISDTWAAVNKDFKVTRCKPNSTIVDTEYDLKIYERNVQVSDITSFTVSLFIEAVVTACPPGVHISIHEHTEELEEEKYIPDFLSIELQKQIEDIETKKNKK